jgi:acetoin utilization deacetylase AcuC-like enzyme
MKVGLVYDPIYLKHDTGGHVENARRLKAIMAHLEQTGLKAELTQIKPRPATTEELCLVHEEQHIFHIQGAAERGGGWLDGDTVMSADSYQAAIYAAGGVIRATEAVMDGKVNSAFALVRPPGHHATPWRAMGFCLFNNLAIATKHALTKYQLERILIIDFDVHHGNGTQEVFYEEPRVLYTSTHQFPLFPGTGYVDEIGSGEARGTTLNIPLPYGCGDQEYELVFSQIMAPAARRFQPQLILVSAGYDPHWADELALMQVSTAGFARIVKIIKELADELCSGKIIFSLEGGYNLDALAASVKATLDVLRGETSLEDRLGQPPQPLPAPDIAPLIKRLKEIHTL